MGVELYHYLQSTEDSPQTDTHLPGSSEATSHPNSPNALNSPKRVLIPHPYQDNEHASLNPNNPGGHISEVHQRYIAKYPKIDRERGLKL